jgi:hypothetical protein
VRLHRHSYGGEVGGVRPPNCHLLFFMST